jgi:hypothetical protein
MQLGQVHSIEQDDRVLEVESAQERIGRVIIACCGDGEIESLVDEPVESAYRILRELSISIEECSVEIGNIKQVPWVRGGSGFYSG